MKDKQPTINVQVRIPITHLATLLRFYTEDRGMCFASKASILREALSDFVNILVTNGKIVAATSAEQSLSYIQEKGVDTKGISRKNLASTILLEGVEGEGIGTVVENREEILKRIQDAMYKDIVEEGEVNGNFQQHK